ADKGLSMTAGEITPRSHVSAKRCSGCIEDSSPVFFYDLPPTAAVRSIRSAFIKHASGTIRQWSIDNIGMPSDPADIGGAPENIGFWLQIECISSRCSHLG